MQTAGGCQPLPRQITAGADQSPAVAGESFLELKGSLRNFSLPDIVQLLGTTRRTGVLIVTAGPDKGSIYFDEGNIVHAAYRNDRGQEAIAKVFLEGEGSFQFLADVEAPEKTVALDWMNVLMEAARVTDEAQRDGKKDPGEEARPSWDPEAVKTAMGKVLQDAFGRKAKKIMEALKSNPGTKMGLLEFCDKAEKYIYVFIDNKRAEEVSLKLRTAIEDSVL